MAVRWIGITLPVAAMTLLLLFGTWQLARSRRFQLFGELVRRVETTDSTVALTFDDGPTAALTDSIIGMLSDREAKATFFIIGNELAANPEAGRRLIAAGHELGNHTYSHARMVLRNMEFIRHEVEATDSLIRAAGQAGAIPFRAPYTYKLVGLPYHLWRTGRTLFTTDIEPESDPSVAGEAERIVAHVLERVRPGSIILLHPWYASRRESLEAIPTLVDSLQDRGYRVTTVGELLSQTVVVRGSDSEGR